MLAGIVGGLKEDVTVPNYQTASREVSLAKVPQKLPAILEFKGQNKFLVTNEKPTWIDFFFFELVNALRWLSEDKIFEEYPALKNYYDAMSSLPNLKEHLQNSNAPEKKLQFNGKSALINGTQTW